MKVFLLLVALLGSPDTEIIQKVFFAPNVQANTLEKCEEIKKKFIIQLSQLHPTKLSVDCIEIDLSALRPGVGV